MGRPMAQSRTPGARPRAGDKERKRQRLADQAALDSARALPDMWSAVARREAEDTGSDSSESWCDTRKPGEDELRAILKSWQLRNLDWNGHDIFKVSLEVLLEERAAGRVPPRNIGIMTTLVGHILKEVADSVDQLRHHDPEEDPEQRDDQEKTAPGGAWSTGWKTVDDGRHLWGQGARGSRWMSQEALREERAADRVPPRNIGIMIRLVGKS